MAFGWAEGVLFPFGFLALAAAGIGAILLGVGLWSWRCRACEVGLHPDWYVPVSERAFPAVRSALAAGDVAAIVTAVHTDPAPPGPPAHELRVDHCPLCGRVARLKLDGRALAAEGDDVVALGELAEVDVPG